MLLLAVPASASAAGQACRTRSVGPLTLVVLQGCWTRAQGALQTSGAVSINGLVLAGPGVVRVDGERVFSTGARTWSARGVRLTRSRFDSTGGSAVWAPASGSLGGLHLIGEVRVRFGGHGSARVRAAVRLPLLPRRFAPVRGAAELTTALNAPRGLSGATIAIQPVRVGRFAVTVLRLRYSKTRRGGHRWSGRGVMEVPAEAVSELGAAGSWVGGRLERLEGTAGGTVPLGYGVVLKQLGVQLRLSPLRIAGSAKATLGALPNGFGAPFEARAKLTFSPLYLWRLDGRVGLTGNLKRVLDAVGAHAWIRGRAQLRLDQSLGVRVGGRLDVRFEKRRLIPRVGIVGSVAGFATAGAFNVEGAVRLRMASFDARARGLISRVGVAACRHIWPGISLGAAYRWGSRRPDVMFRACSVAAFRVVLPANAFAGLRRPFAAAAPVTRQVEVDRGLPLEVFSAASRRGVPNIVVVDPNGRRYDTARIGNTRRRTVVRRGDVLVWHAVAERNVYLAVRNPPEGTWTVEPSRSSAPLLRVRAGDGLPRLEISARATGTGASRILEYAVHRSGGQPIPEGLTVDFYESPEKAAPGAVRIGGPFSGVGTQEFLPAPLGPRTRYVHAVVSYQGLPLEARAVAAFTFEPPSLPPPPTLNAARLEREVVVTWSGEGASSWIVRSTVGDGAADVDVLPSKAAIVRVAAEPRHEVAVSVTPVDLFGREGQTTRIVVRPGEGFREGLEVTVSGEGTVKSSPPGIYCPADCNESFPRATTVDLVAMPVSGWSFLGWGGACSGVGGCSVTLNRSAAVTAAFGLRLAVGTTGGGTVASEPGGIACGGDCEEIYPAGSVVRLTAAADPGWTFVGWSGACVGTGACTVTMTQTQAVGAIFGFSLLVRTTGKGIVSSEPAGISCPTDCRGAYAAGSVVTLRAQPSSTFLGWAGACAGTAGDVCRVVVDRPVSVSAGFGARLNVEIRNVPGASGTVASVPAGILCQPDCGEVYVLGTIVRLTARVGLNSFFTGWSKPCTGTGPCDLVMDRDRTVIATFDYVPP